MDHRQQHNIHTHAHVHTHTCGRARTHTHTHTHRHGHRHTDTQTHRHADTHTHRHTDTQIRQERTVTEDRQSQRQYNIHWHMLDAIQDLPSVQLGEQTSPFSLMEAPGEYKKREDHYSNISSVLSKEGHLSQYHKVLSKRPL